MVVWNLDNLEVLEKKRMVWSVGKNHERTLSSMSLPIEFSLRT